MTAPSEYRDNEYVVAERYSKMAKQNLYRVIWTQASKEFTLNATELRNLAEALDDAIDKYSL